MRRLFFVLFVNLAFLPPPAQAETIYLKSGKVIEAAILAEEPDYIRIDFHGTPLYYEKKYIKKIEKTPFNEDARAENTENPAGFSPEVSFVKGLESAAAGDFVIAREEFKRGIVLKGDDYNLIAGLNLLDELEEGKVSRDYVLDLSNGLLNMLRNDYTQAIQCFERALKVKPDNVDILYNLGVCRYSQGDYKQAIDCFRRLLNIRPEDPEAYSLLGNSYYLNGQEQEARESFILARELFRKAQDAKSAGEMEVLLNRLFKH
jgi:tetratricopeptide (TPR) repeat protein